MITSALLADPVRAWTRFVPAADDPWDLPRVAHLHRRAGFAVRPGLQASATWCDGPGRSIDRILDGEPTTSDADPPPNRRTSSTAWPRNWPLRLRSRDCRGIWLYRMIFTAQFRPRAHDRSGTTISPLWNTKVNNTALMQGQNDLLRTHALGRFPTFLRAIARDPAMLIWLDSAANRKGVSE